MEAYDSDSQKKSDVTDVFAHAVANGNVFITGTEAGSGSLPNLIRDEAKRRNWWCYVHGSGEWVCFDKAWGSHVAHG